jgi:hypothetical protein
MKATTKPVTTHKQHVRGRARPDPVGQVLDMGVRLRHQAARGAPGATAAACWAG